MPSVRGNRHSRSREQGLRREDGIPSFIFVYHNESLSMDSAESRHDYHEAFRGRDSRSRDGCWYGYQGYSGGGNRAERPNVCHDRRGNEHDYESERRFRDGRSGRHLVQDNRYNSSRRDERHRSDNHHRGNDCNRSEGRRESNNNHRGSTWNNNDRSSTRPLRGGQYHGSHQSSRGQKRNRY